MFDREFTIKLLSDSFPNMTSIEVTQFLKGLFKSKNDCMARFKGDFLVQLKEFSAQDNKDVCRGGCCTKREKGNGLRPMRYKMKWLILRWLIFMLELNSCVIDGDALGYLDSVIYICQCKCSISFPFVSRIFVVEIS